MKQFDVKPLPWLSLSSSLSSLSLVLVCALSLSACGGPGGWQAPPPVVETVISKQQPWTVTYAATGTLEANNNANINAESPGNITAILVKEGQSVTRGQVLMRLKADKQLAQVQESAAAIAASLGNVEQQKSDIQQAQFRLESAATRKRLAESELQRFEKLYKEQFISQLELEQRRSAYDTAASAYEEALQATSSAKARAAQASSSLAQARSNYSYSVAVAGESLVRAPFSGVVGQKYVDLGDYASPGQMLMTLVDPSRFKIQFTVPERFLSQIRPGMPVTAKFEGLGDAIFTGQVNFIDPVVDKASHTVTLKAVIPASPQLRHGMLGTVALALSLIEKAVVIPEEAIVPQGEKTFVYVVKNEFPPAKPDNNAKGKAATPITPRNTAKANIAHLQEVQVGHREAGFVQIHSGLRAGESVIVNGLQKVSDSMEVNLQESPSGKTPGAVETGKGH